MDSRLPQRVQRSALRAVHGRGCLLSSATDGMEPGRPWFLCYAVRWDQLPRLPAAAGTNCQGFNATLVSSCQGSRGGAFDHRWTF